MKVPAISVLMTDGFHVPVMPSSDTPGKDGGSEFWHNGPIWLKVGVICGDMVIDIVVTIAHCDGLLGVKVYVNVPATVAFIDDGVHVPVMPSSDTPGKAGGIEFWHRGPICVKVGVIWVVIVIFIVVIVPHCDGSFGVKV